MPTNVINTKKRLLVMLVVVTVLILLLLIRVGYWSLYMGDWLQSEAASQWTKDEKVFAKRGSITDRNFNVLAQSAVVETVVLRPQRIKETDVDKVTDALSRILELPREEVYKKVSTKTREENGQTKDVVEVWLKRQVETKQAEEIKSLELPGVGFVSDIKRFYPNKDFATQLIGYTSMDGVGQTGIEKRYNRVLEGRHGRKVAETAKNGYGIPNGQEMLIQPQNGYNVVLTIDEIVQSFLENECQSLYDSSQLTSVQGTVMDIQTGEVLGMVNLPEFDLNEVPRTDNDLMKSTSANRVIATPYSIGSAFDVITAAMALNENNSASTYECPGFITVENKKILCSDIHGTQTLEGALHVNCTNNASMQAVAIGKEKFYEYLENMGLNVKPGINLSSESMGDILKIKYVQDEELARMGSGELMKITQLQYATALSGILNKGIKNSPQVIRAVVDDENNVVEKPAVTEPKQVVSEIVFQAINTTLLDYVARGEGDLAQITNYNVGGIAGSSPQYIAGEVVENKEYVTFAAYAPTTNPKYLVVISADGVEKSDNSMDITTPYVKKVLEETLRYSNVPPDNKNAVTQEKIAVPNLVGLSLQDAQTALSEAKLTFKADGTGTVSSQMPVAAQEVYEGSIISLNMDTKTVNDEVKLEMAEVPDVVGMDLNSARRAIYSAGLYFTCTGSGNVKTQYPLAGIDVQKGNTITIELSNDIS